MIQAAHSTPLRVYKKPALLFYCGHSAYAAANVLINPPYREGWKL